MTRVLAFASVIFVALGLQVWGNSSCDGHHEGAGLAAHGAVAAEAASRPGVGALGAVTSLAGGASGDSIHELHCHKMGLGPSSGLKAAMAEGAQDTGRDLGKKWTASVPPSALLEDSHTALPGGLERLVGFLADHVPKGPDFLTTSRLLL